MCHSWWERVPGVGSVDARDAVNDPAMHRAPPPPRGIWPHCSSAEAESPVHVSAVEEWLSFS